MSECRAWNDGMEHGVLGTRHIGGYIGGETPQERTRRRKHEPAASAEDLEHLRKELAQRFGSARAAAHAYAGRYGLSPLSGERVFERVRVGEHIGHKTADRLRVLLAS